MGLIILAVAVVALLAAPWLTGASEPVYRIVRGAAWFVAVRGAKPPALASGVSITWSARADFPFIGNGEPYWSRFYVLAGNPASTMPIDLVGVEDAFVARVAFGAPPKLALGILKLLVTFGVLGKPAGAVSHDVQTKGYRAELMPGQAAIARLLAQPSGYAPNVVNFLSYFPSARYADGRASSGRAAYARYGLVALRTVYRTGGHLLFYGRITEVLREATGGPTTGAWSDVAAMLYPTPSAILTMENVAAYRAALHHRDAGLERTIVIASTDQRLTP
ncbi:MAG: hypothetical protein HY054_03185 [Proteobacteria bacterium]|nr:hypothetical protein [Pseudomonadota bacterium]